MPMFKARMPNTEVSGAAVLAIVDGVTASKQSMLRILAQKGIDVPTPGKWYSQQAWLDAFKEIAETIGPNTLFAIGQKIPETAVFPSGAGSGSIEEGLLAIDIAYHMNHRIDGKVLFDERTGTMLEGIGHYRVEKRADKALRVTCLNPYPCDFDRGIIAGMAKRCKPAGSIFVGVTHEDPGPCRKRGAELCHYKVTWR